MPSLANANKQTQVIHALERGVRATIRGKTHDHGTSRRVLYRDTEPSSVKVNTLRAILKQCGLSEAKYLELYAGKRI